MKTLQDIAKQFKSLTLLNLKTPPTRAYKTGNLYDNVQSYNTIGRMITKRPTVSKVKQELDIEDGNVSISYSPPGAKYGKYVEGGTRFMKARPFAGDAANSPALQKTIMEYQKDVAKAVGLQMHQQIGKVLKKASSKR